MNRRKGTYDPERSKTSLDFAVSGFAITPNSLRVPPLQS